MSYKPFDFVSRLSNEEPLGTGLYLGTPRVYRYLAVPSILAFYLNGQQQKFQFCEAQPIRYNTTSIRQSFRILTMCKVIFFFIYCRNMCRLLKKRIMRK